MTLVAGVDSSTQSCKVVIVDARTGVVIREGRASHPEGTEVDPEAWWKALNVAVLAAGGLADVAAISVAAQQHGLVALDRDGRVVRPALLWNDTRSAAAAANLVDEFGASWWAERTGLVPVASFTVTKLRWLRDHEPDLAAQVAAVALPHDWLTWRLRGYGPGGDSPLGPDLDALTTDGSDASGTGYWNPAQRTYLPELFLAAFSRPLREAGGPGPTNGVTVPRVVEPLHPTGALSVPVALGEHILAPAGLIVGPGAGDNAAAALGLDLENGDVVVSLGTSGTVFSATPTVTASADGVVAGFADAQGNRLPIVTTMNAAQTLTYVAQLLRISLDELGELATAAPSGADGLVLVPYFVGERTPNRPDATASLTGLIPANLTRQHLSRAAIEGMLCGLADGISALSRSGIRPARIQLIGGAAGNTAVRRIASEVFGRTIVVPEPTEFVALGAARQAAAVLAADWPSWPVSRTEVTAQPQPETLATYRSRANDVH